jgi:hypothetical protein
VSQPKKSPTDELQTAFNREAKGLPKDTLQFRLAAPAKRFGSDADKAKAFAALVATVKKHPDVLDDARVYVHERVLLRAEFVDYLEKNGHQALASRFRSAKL